MTMQKFIDAHCHFNPSVQTPINESVVGWVCNSVNTDDWGRILNVANNNPQIYPCIGIHPWAVSGIPSGWNTQMRDLLQQNPMAMVGEIGLDRLHSDFDAQRTVFMQQYKIATEMRRTVHIHSVRAWDEILHVLTLGNTPPVIIFHGFNGTPEIINELMRHANVYFSYSRAVLDPRRHRLGNCVLNTPTNRILIESDDQIGVNANILRTICNEIAKIKSVDADIMSNIIYDNTLLAINNGQITSNATFIR